MPEIKFTRCTHMAQDSSRHLFGWPTIVAPGVNLSDPFSAQCSRCGKQLGVYVVEMTITTAKLYSRHREIDRMLVRMTLAKVYDLVDPESDPQPTSIPLALYDQRAEIAKQVAAMGHDIDALIAAIKTQASEQEQPKTGPDPSVN